MMLNCVHAAKHHDTVKQETPKRRRVDIFLKTSQLLLSAGKTKTYLGGQGVKRPAQV